MGLIKAAMGATGGVLADQWKEYFYCESLPDTIMAVKGRKRTSGRSSNTKGSDNIISDGSVIAVADGQCVLIVEQGKVVDVCAEPGEYTYSCATEPSIFTGGLNRDSILAVLDNVGKRFTFGGEAPKDQRVYYFNTKELMGNKYGTPTPVPFKVVDEDIGFKATVGIKCFGEYSIRITNPLLFYTNVCGNMGDTFARETIAGQLRTELLTALQPAFARLSRVDYTALPAHTMELADALNEVLSAKWRDLRGIEIVSFGVSSVTANEADEERLKKMQDAAFIGGGNVMAGTAVSAQADALRAAAANPNGAATGFIGMGMAQGMGSGMLTGVPLQDQPNVFAGAAPAAPAANGWKCACGATATGKFCPQCGAKKPEPAAGWTCPECGAVNQGKFCQNCGAKKPAGAPQYKCDKCGWVPEDPANPPKFCPECGDPFGEEDIQ